MLACKVSPYCHEQVKVSVWWPGLSTQLENLVYGFPICCKFQNQPAKLLLPPINPTLLWQKVATDFFKWKNHHIVSGSLFLHVYQA